MPSSRSVRIVVDALHGDLHPEALLAHVHAAGVEPHEAMDIIAEHASVPDDYDDLEETRWGTDWIAALVAVYGIEEASRIAARTVHFADIDLAAHYAAVRARAAIIDEVPVSRAYALIAAPEIPDDERSWLFDRMAYVYPLEELAYLDDLPASHTAELARALTKRTSPLDAFDELLDQIEDERVLSTLGQFWQVDVMPDSPAPIIELAARLCVDACRPMTSVIPLAERRGEPSVWLPILRAHGLKGSLVMLRMLERGEAPLLVAQVLADAGYPDDEVLAALLENGVGSSASLELLRAHGWSAERMVASLAHRGALLPEVRDQLVELGVPVSAQRALLREHWEPAVVELVLGAERPAPPLPSGD